MKFPFSRKTVMHAPHLAHGIYTDKSEPVVEVKSKMKIFERERTSYQCSRVVFMGGPGVGKSAIIARYLYGDYREYHERTVEDFHSRTFKIGTVLLQLDIIDTTGSYVFPAMRRVAMAKGDVFALVYSVDDFQSFEEVLAIQKEIHEQRPRRNYSVVVVGNKLDLREKREIAPDEAEMMSCGESREEFLETSARDNINIECLFERIFCQSVNKEGISS
ncbi:GTP-binding protein Rhes-like [Ptychodera flava]|uniref:GTP-binding protein Rhes-like n=1 Tax=Ptychodera flava TaxID=63121 RepID=UPI00396A5F8C